MKIGPAIGLLVAGAALGGWLLELVPAARTGPPPLALDQVLDRTLEWLHGLLLALARFLRTR